MKSMRLLAILITVALMAAVFPIRPARAASLVEVTNFGTNPTGLRMYLYVPNNVAAQPAILVAVHYCTGSGPAFFSGTEFASLADQYGFIIIYPSATRNGNCFDVSSPQALTHNGGSDPVGIVSMVTYVEQHNNGDSSRVYVTGASSGGMMTNVLLGDYPDVFKAGAAFMGVPFACFATTSGGDPTNPANQAGWNSTCSAGQSIKTPQQWGDLVRGAFPGYSGARPRMQVWHGTADTTLSYPNFGEEIKQWTNVLGVSQTPSFTDTPQSGWTRTRYGGTGIGAPVEAISIQGVGHSLPLAGQAAMAIQFFGLNQTGATPTRTLTRTNTATGPTPTRTITQTPTAGNLLTNADMEGGTTNWVVNGSGTLSSDTSQFHGGTHSVKTTGRTAEWNGIGQNVAVSNFPTSGQNYSVAVWVRSQTGTPTAKATLRLTAGSTTYVGLATAAISSTGWTLVTGTVPVSWSGTLTGVLFYVETLAGTDNLYIDDASLTRNTGPTSTPTLTRTVTNTPTIGPSLTPSLTATPGSSNFLTNADMEGGTGNWVVNGAGTLSSDTSQFHGGTHSVKITGRTAAWNGIGQNLAVSNFPTSGQNYTVSVWVRSQSGSPTAIATLRLTAGSTTYINMASAAINSSGWTLVTGTVPVSWSGTLTGVLFYVESAAGTDNLYIDDASLHR